MILICQVFENVDVQSPTIGNSSGVKLEKTRFFKSKFRQAANFGHLLFDLVRLGF